MRQGFQENYECIAAADFGSRNPSPRSLLTKAIALIRVIAAETSAPQFARQIAAFANYAEGLADGTAGPDEVKNTACSTSANVAAAGPR